MGEEAAATPHVAVNDVVQLDPARCPWGPLLGIVCEVAEWGITFVAIVPVSREQGAGFMPMRVKHGDYRRIGAAAWCRDV